MITGRLSATNVGYCGATQVRFVPAKRADIADVNAKVGSATAAKLALGLRRF
jgi:hypothetical protein